MFFLKNHYMVASIITLSLCQSSRKTFPEYFQRTPQFCRMIIYAYCFWFFLLFARSTLCIMSRRVGRHLQDSKTIPPFERLFNTYVTPTSNKRYSSDPQSAVYITVGGTTNDNPQSSKLSADDDSAKAATLCIGCL